jgi:hypothetical protein
MFKTYSLTYSCNTAIALIVLATTLTAQTFDTDGDGFQDDSDNCPVQHNPDQLDVDADGLGDVCDICPTDPVNDDPDQDFVCTSLDQCPSSDLRDLVDVNGTLPGETTILNRIDIFGCSIQDQVNTCAENAAGQRQYRTCIIQLANELYQVGVITQWERLQMIAGAVLVN